MKLYVLWMFLVALVFFSIQRDKGLKAGHIKMCKKITEEFVEKFNANEFEHCKSIYTRSGSFRAWKANMNSWFKNWGWSHFAVYSPFESNEIWKSETKNIGVKFKYFKGKYLVYRAHPDSVFKRGDVLVKINKEKLPLRYGILHSGGNYIVKRKGKIKILKVKVQKYIWNDRVQIVDNIIKVLSFRGEFFNDKAIVDVMNGVRKIKGNKIYIDLRDNYGGNIAAGLRFLSIFLCEEIVVGEFSIPSKKEFGSSDYPLSVKQSIQVPYLKKYGKVFLRVPKANYCTNKKIFVLVNSITSSTAEIVAQAFIDTNRGKVIGERTSGRVVLSSWEPIFNFPDGFYFSYPYAFYKSLSGAYIERKGVSPHIYKTYSFDLEKMGKDSFIN